MKQNTPFRYDVVGSYLRPDYLKEARENYKRGLISRQDLTAIEDKAIIDLIQKQKQVGLKVITDGEFRRNSWHLDFFWGFEGVGHQKTETGIPFNDEAALIDDTYLVSKIKVKNHPFVDHFKFVKQFEDENTVAKQTIPSPAQFLFQCIMPQNIKSTFEIYDSEEELVADIVAGYRQVIKELYDAGCRNIQLDDCTWGVFVDPHARDILLTDDAGIDVLITKFVAINNQVIADQPEDLVINSHICRGNFHSTWACQGGYDRVAKELFGKEKVNAFYLEYDSDRAGGFEPLKEITGDKKVVLGLVTSKFPELEDKEVLKARVKEASQYISLDRLYLSPQCGFASTEEGNKLTEEQQWDKIRLVKEVAEEIWR